MRLITNEDPKITELNDLKEELSFNSNKNNEDNIHNNEIKKESKDK